MHFKFGMVIHAYMIDHVVEHETDVRIIRYTPSSIVTYAHGKNSAFLPLPSSPFFPTLTFPRDGQHVTKYHATCMKLQGKLVDDHDSAWNHVPIVVRAYYLPHHPYPAQPPILLSENML